MKEHTPEYIAYLVELDKIGQEYRRAAVSFHMASMSQDVDTDSWLVLQWEAEKKYSELLGLLDKGKTFTEKT
jgi:hypothetical protein